MSDRPSGRLIAIASGVPRSAATQVGLRGVMTDKEANNIMSTMRAREVAVDVQPWSRRFRVYTEMIKSGSPVEIAKVLRSPEVQEKLSASGAEPVGNTPEQFGAYVAAEVQKWERVVKQAKIPPVQ